jgi:hypothetical protein
MISYSGDGGLAVLSSFNFIASVAADSAGNVYIADSGNHRIREVSTDGIVRTIAGNGQAGSPGSPPMER